MRGGELSDGDIRSSLVSLKRLVGRVLSLVTGSELGEVSVVVSHPVGISNASDVKIIKSSHF